VSVPNCRIAGIIAGIRGERYDRSTGNHRTFSTCSQDQSERATLALTPEAGSAVSIAVLESGHLF
jgi:hypothetical protein